MAKGKLTPVKLENLRQYLPKGICSICEQVDIPVVMAGNGDGVGICANCAEAIVALHGNMKIMLTPETK